MAITALRVRYLVTEKLLVDMRMGKSRGILVHACNQPVNAALPPR
jgi:hypothetical protein